MRQRPGKTGHRGRRFLRRKRRHLRRQFPIKRCRRSCANHIVAVAPVAQSLRPHPRVNRPPGSKRFHGLVGAFSPRREHDIEERMNALPLGKIFMSLKNGGRINLFARREPDAVTLEKGFCGIAHPAIELFHWKAPAFGTGGQCICPGRRRSIPISSGSFVDGLEHLSVRALPLFFLSRKALR